MRRLGQDDNQIFAHISGQLVNMQNYGCITLTVILSADTQAAAQLNHPDVAQF